MAAAPVTAIMMQFVKAKNQCSLKYLFFSACCSNRLWTSAAFSSFHFDCSCAAGLYLISDRMRMMMILDNSTETFRLCASTLPTSHLMSWADSRLTQKLVCSHRIQFRALNSIFGKISVGTTEPHCADYAWTISTLRTRWWHDDQNMRTQEDMKTTWWWHSEKSYDKKEVDPKKLTLMAEE